MSITNVEKVSTFNLDNLGNLTIYLYLAPQEAIIGEVFA
jgi:hypothetical protein